MSAPRKTGESKLFTLKEWLTLADAAKHLSIVFGEEVNEADVLRLALDGRLRLSAWFVNHAQVRQGRLVPLAECLVSVYRKDLKKGEPLVLARDVRPGDLSSLPEGVQAGLKENSLYLSPQGIHYRDEEFLVLEPGVESIDGIWDLPMLAGERLDIEHLYQMMTSGPEVTLTNLEGAFVERGNVICQLMESEETNEFVAGSTAHLEKLEERISGGEIEPADAARMLAAYKAARIAFKEKRRTQSKAQGYYPAAGLPADTVYVVRTAALREFEQAVMSPAESADQPIPARAERSYLNIIGALLHLMRSNTPSGRPQSVFQSEAAVIAALLGEFEGKPGITKRTLEEKFAAGKRSLSPP